MKSLIGIAIVKVMSLVKMNASEKVTYEARLHFLKFEGYHSAYEHQHFRIACFPQGINHLLGFSL